MGKIFEPDNSCIYGRIDDKESIVGKLLSSPEDDGNQLQIISILGMGGTGKTFLAKLIYCDKRVQDWFDIKAWVCAAAKFDIFKVAKDILEEITSRTACNNDSQVILAELKNNLKGKRFLLILDDVWNDNGTEWNLLIENLNSGLSGNKIIVTTRNQSVGLAFGSEFHFLCGLSDDECWGLFAKHAFNGDDYTNPNHPRLAILGKEIVRKCKGLPLIAIMLGDFLSSVKDVEEWEKIMYNMEVCCNYNVFMILKLSHVDLLFHLRQCLAYGIKSPKDYELVKRNLVLSWIQEINKRKDIEVLGGNYFDESREFIIQDFGISAAQSSFHSSFVVGRDTEVIFERGMTITSLVLEISLVTLDQIASPKRPHYGLIALVVSLVAMFICITELVYKGQKHNIRLKRICCLHSSSSNQKYPFTILDFFTLISSISQLIFTCVSYSYICRDVENTIKVSFVPVIYITCTAFFKLFCEPQTNQLPN